jgi:probable selenium-dependent hydroxylase accessory protein YqeC
LADMTEDADDVADLLDALGARRGIVCLVGAGGKKTTMVRLATRHPGHVGLTATARVPFRLKRDSADLISLPDDVDVADAVIRIAGPRVVGYAGARRRNYRLAGLDPATIVAIHDAADFDATYVKADGARMRLAKAHKPGEPSLVPGAATILLFASVHALGRVIDEKTVHRPDRFAAIAGAKLGDTISPVHLAAVLSHQTLTLIGADSGGVIPVINMADNAALLDLARETAGLLWNNVPALDRIAITAMIQPEPLKELLTRRQPC